MLLFICWNMFTIQMMSPNTRCVGRGGERDGEKLFDKVSFPPLFGRFFMA